VVQVESDVVVPIEVVSNKAEYAARTIRPKIHRHLADFMVALRTVPLEKDSLGLKQAGLDLSSIPTIIDQMKLSDQPGPAVGFFRGGTSEGKRIFRAFLEQRLASYNKNRNQPQTDDVSHMSKYLHFGQISPLFLALEAEENGKSGEDVDTFIEELVIRRDLAINFVYYTKDYDQYRCLPNWAQETLQAHTADKQDVIYSRSELEQAQTHDPYWNAAQNEMRCTGYMHNYMRMYWGKKILEWSRTPKEAFRVALSLNNQYFIDGRDPNSFAGVGWVFGLHDRPWKERPIFGKIRYMAASGLERKADMAAYLKKVEQLMETAQEKQQGQ
jgi:deoxyribodipyrimidine photo-lyase